jgi:hypothetical protein
VVRAGAGFNADGARRQRGHQRVQFGPRHPRLQQLRLADFVHAVQREDILGEIDSNGQNGHDFPFRVS